VWSTRNPKLRINTVMPVAMTASRKFGISRDSLRQKHGPAFWGYGGAGAGAVQAATGEERPTEPNQFGLACSRCDGHIRK